MIRAPTILALGLALGFGLGLAAMPAIAAPDHAASRDKLEQCAKAFTAHGLDEAVARCTEATADWPENHRAWYVLGLAQTSRDWAAAVAAFTHAVDLHADDPMYQMWLGIALYELAAHKPGTDPELSADAVAPAGEHLARALALEPGLWRARFYLGRVHIATGEAKLAATDLTAAIKAHADFAPPYFALAELYRRWAYSREAAMVATVGTEHVTDPAELTQLWFLLGVTEADARNDDSAIAAFDHVLADRPDHPGALVQRGAAYFRTKAFAKAKIDLTAALKTSLEPIQAHMVQQLLLEIAAKKK